MARDFLLNFGTLNMSGSIVSVPTLTTNTGYSTGTSNLLVNGSTSVVDLGLVGGQSNRSELFAKINVNVSAVGSTSGTGDYIVFVPLVEASKDGTNFSIVSTLPVDVSALKVTYATASTISGDTSVQAFVPLYAPAGQINNSITISGSSDPRGANGLIVADDNYRFFRCRIMSHVLGSGSNNAPSGSAHTVTAYCTGAVVNGKDGAI